MIITIVSIFSSIIILKIITIIIIDPVGGSAWSLTSAPLGYWQSIASDSVGSVLVAGGTNSGGTYVSYDFSPSSHPSSVPSTQPTG